MLSFLSGVAVTLIVCLAAMWFAHRRHKEFLQYTAKTIESLANADGPIRMYNPDGRGDSGVALALNQTALRIDEQMAQLSEERDVLQHILHRMTTGLVYVRRGGRIQMVNEAAAKMFRRPREQWVEREHRTMFRNYNLCMAIDHALLFGTEWSSEIRPRDQLPLEVRVVPIQPTTRLKDAGYDVLILFNDVSEWRRLEQMRTEFVANVSHELRTPIAAIRGFAETLLDGDVDEETQRTFMQTIYDEARRMGNLVSDLLELSKLEGADRTIRFGRVNLAEVVESAAQRLSQQFETHLLSFSADLKSRHFVWADEEKLLQVFLNLFSNAIQYTLAGGSIRVWCEEVADRVKIHVLDTGIGIPVEHQSRVFERFYRVSKDRSRVSGGTGLGLAIVKHIVTVHGGEVGVESQLGVGSDFWFSLARLDDAVKVESSAKTS